MWAMLLGSSSRTFCVTGRAWCLRSFIRAVPMFPLLEETIHQAWWRSERFYGINVAASLEQTASKIERNHLVLRLYDVNLFVFNNYFFQFADVLICLGKKWALLTGIDRCCSRQWFNCCCSFSCCRSNKPRFRSEALDLDWCLVPSVALDYNGIFLILIWFPEFHWCLGFVRWSRWL